MRQQSFNNLLLLTLLPTNILLTFILFVQMEAKNMDYPFDLVSHSHIKFF